MIALIETVESRTLLSGNGVQRANVQKLVTDLTAIHAKSSVTQAQITTFYLDLKAATVNAVRPSATTVDRLRIDAKKAAADHKLSDAEKAQLTKDVQNVLVSAHIPLNLAKAVANDAKAIFSATNITADDVKLIVGDVNAIVKTFQTNHQQ